MCSISNIYFENSIETEKKMKRANCNLVTYLDTFIIERRRHKVIIATWLSPGTNHDIFYAEYCMLHRTKARRFENIFKDKEWIMPSGLDSVLKVLPLGQPEETELWATANIIWWSAIWGEFDGEGKKALHAVRPFWMWQHNRWSKLPRKHKISRRRITKRFHRET